MAPTLGVAMPEVLVFSPHEQGGSLIDFISKKKAVFCENAFADIARCYETPFKLVGCVECAGIEIRVDFIVAVYFEPVIGIESVLGVEEAEPPAEVAELSFEGEGGV
jgi:hypothetical protein